MALRSWTTYATINAAGKKIKLKVKYPMKLWPFRPATRRPEVTPVPPTAYL
jgi:hypothetical protein